MTNEYGTRTKAKNVAKVPVVEGSTVIVDNEGAPWPYADSIYAGTVVAESEEDAVSNLSQMRNVKNIPMSKDQVNWHSPYFERFEKTGENEWEFKIIEEFTG